MTPEEKLLRAIFGEKASDVRDTSLRLPPGVAGTIVDVRVFNRHGIDKDERAMAIEREEIERLKKDSDDERNILNRATWSRLKEMLLGQVATAAPKGLKKGARSTPTCSTASTATNGGSSRCRTTRPVEPGSGEGPV
jgi:DNA-directed RNA polymerase subunit beta